MVAINSADSDECHWDGQVAANTELFRQADLLDEAAYQIIQDDRGNADTWRLFSEAKTRAAERRTLAYQDWMRIKREMQQ